MIYLLSLLCSLTIQFAAVDFPISIVSQNATHETFVQTVVANFNYTYNKSIDYKYVIITRRNNNTYPYYLWIPIELYDSSVTSSISCNSRTDTYCSITNVGWIRYQVMSNATVPTSTSPNTTSSIGNLYYSDSQVNNGLIYNGYYTLPFNQIDTFDVGDNANTPDSVGFGGLGAMSPSGHSSGDNPFETLGGSSINWASVTGHSNGGSIGPSPHSQSTHFSSTTPSPDTNDSKTDSLLYMLGNKLADITENTGAIGDILGGIMYNQITSASALFNALSGINENLKETFTPPSKEDFVAVLHTSEIYASYQNINTAINTMTSTLNNVGQQSNYVWAIPLPNAWGGSLTFNFSDYIKSTDLNSVRILIGALLILSTIIFVAHQLPDIIGGGSGGENA